MSLKYGVFLPTGVTMDLAGIKDPIEAYEALTQVAQVADESGYESVWIADHFHTVPPSQAALFECWTTAAALARDTKRVRIGQMVTGNSYRNPALQAKMASTLDVLSHGRYTFGIGAGYYEHEYRAYGYEYPDATVRLQQLREAVPGASGDVERGRGYLRRELLPGSRRHQSAQRGAATAYPLADRRRW
jgi:alkanesulfonate monooxygenase SsuD/methylene tetrahydromethanopterin reductase-like flavin-dependent oxidoreductase (luciferase family)